MAQTLRIGGRGSPLAIRQSEIVRDALQAICPHLKMTVHAYETKGDRLKDQPLSDHGGKGLFCKEVEDALLRGDVDLVVHSAKDMSTALRPGVRIAAYLKREDPRDAFLSLTAKDVQSLKPGATVGTASLRRQVQALDLRPDLNVVLLRGNVGTRIEKLEAGKADATFLAVAGLKRLGRLDVAQKICTIAEMLPAVGQGALCICVRSEDHTTFDLMQLLNHRPTALQVNAERSLLRTLDGNCRTPIGGYAQLKKGKLFLQGLLASEDGKIVVRASARGVNGVALGKKVAFLLRQEFQKRHGE